MACATRSVTGRCAVGAMEGLYIGYGVWYAICNSGAVGDVMGSCGYRAKVCRSVRQELQQRESNRGLHCLFPRVRLSFCNGLAVSVFYFVGRLIKK